MQLSVCYHLLLNYLKSHRYIQLTIKPIENKKILMLTTSFAIDYYYTMNNWWMWVVRLLIEFRYQMPLGELPRGQGSRRFPCHSQAPVQSYQRHQS